MGLRPAVLALAAAASLAWAGSARADAAADVEKAHNAYVAKQYGEAESRLRTLLDPKSDMKDADMIAEARMYLGATLLAEGKKDEASAIFETLLLDKPDYQPDPLRVSLDAINALTDVRARMREKLAAIQAEKVRLALEEKARLETLRLKEAARLALLEKLAAEEYVVHPNSRWIAALPFGVGQFQNGQTVLGWIFLGVQAGFAIGTGIATALKLDYGSQAIDANNRGDTFTADQLHARAQQAWIADLSLAGGFVLAVAAGIAHAELTFVPPYTEVRKRATPKLALSPAVAPRANGAFVGLQVTF
jgi:hypothetical protein